MTGKIALRIATAHHCIAIFSEALNAEDWAKCVEGDDDPDSFCDSNMVVAEAYEKAFGYDPSSMFDTSREAEMSANWNAAVRLASILMVGVTPTAEEEAQIVEQDNSAGLSLVGGGRRLQSIVQEFSLSP